MVSSRGAKAATQDAVAGEVAAPESQQVAVITPEERALAHNVAAATRQTNDAHMQNFMNWLVEQADGGDTDTYATMAAIMGEIMAAENPAEVMKEKQMLSGKDVVGRAFLLHSFTIRAGSYEDSMFQHYAVLDVSPPGIAETRVLTTGAAKVLMKLYALSRFNEWPQPIMFTSNTTSKGYEALDIVSY